MDEFVKKQEFNTLKEQVNKLEDEMSNSKKMLVQIDKKLDVIGERLKSNDVINELKNKNIIEQVEHNTSEINNIRGNQVKFVFMIIGEALGLVALVIKSFIK